LETNDISLKITLERALQPEREPMPQFSGRSQRGMVGGGTW
jgi:hypothetical protein